ncbi:pyridoxal phosphate-dependent aminotransferase [Candidatus Xianfuyuplasma coldseepsis]|uniref:Aminotransferase class I/II-fold pyridoxal phosphate-dependent enzyme n=1 Tax=Candidatus Xianfuyuplasma coldseepsis TaxID=2782163 RepID=A0A7L7KNJ6_9MOLU|nr:aminotransferase class I/II-fold pyridoxal phosphate-dependent enzyme [Xianfuyuplasma coldseepsis]QMS84197.1 aminotransferase class I/II-fold pyridoxal phosphate-dependent enzyme [Xianfuyuplasma coldseepsis]
MSFLNSHSDGKKMVDKVFKAAVKAKQAKLEVGDDAVVDATLGTLFDEHGTFVAFDSVWNSFQSLSNIQKAKYAAGIQGNPTFRKAVYTWLFGDTDIPCEIIATPGGAGAVSSTIKNVLNPGDTLVKPHIAWGPYNTMANEFQVNTMNYELFDGDQFNCGSFLATCQQVMNEQGKVLAIINDPCHNPSGYTMTSDEWDTILHGLTQLSHQGPVIILHDIAYVDFSTTPEWKSHFQKYQQLSHNMMVVIAFSLSKTFTAYGMRVGAAVAISSNMEELVKFRDAEIYSARSIWSTVNNSVMDLFTMITTTPSMREEYLAEKTTYVDIIKQRADIFIEEAKDVGLPLYPYKEGFFATIKVAQDQVEYLGEQLQKHHIYTVEVAHGLRIALCSVPKHKLYGLAQRIKTIIEQ